ncbi:MAG: P-loop NTPase fold protein [candidate division Zixibacteria bacterium]|nr:P-loop NTPase fold protein [candidate division Zixibacteria bacterium]
MAKKASDDAVEALALLSDQPIGEGTPTTADGLGFKMYSRVLAEVAIQTPGPFTVGVFGEWGTGKTSLMRLVEEYLATRKNVITVWFNAWRFESDEQPIVPLVATIVREIERNKDFLATLEDGGRTFLRSLRAVAYGFSAKSKVKIPGFAEIEASFVAKDMIERSEAIAPDPLLDRSIFFDAFQQLSRARVPSKTRVVVLIDDLDRCFPDRAIKLLESIKLVLAQPGFIFFLGVARRVIEGYLQHRYEKEYGISGFEGYAYLDKIVQLPFHIPPHRNRMSTFWDSVMSRLTAGDRKSFKELVPIIDVASGSNPRTAVRFVNNLLVDRAIFRATAGDEAFREMPVSFFAVSRSMQQRWPAMYVALARSDEICQKVAQWLSIGIPEVDSIDDPAFKEAAGLLKVHHELVGLLKTEYGLSWLTDHARRSATIDFLQKERLWVPEDTSDTTVIYDVFLRYDRGDMDSAELVRRILAEEGLKVFDINMKSSTAIMLQGVPASGISSSRFVLYLIGGGGKSRDYLRWEIDLSLLQKKRVITVLLPGVDIESLPSELRPKIAFGLNQISRESLSSIVRLITETR